MIQELIRDYFQKYNRFPNVLEINKKDLYENTKDLLMYSKLDKIDTIYGLKVILSDEYNKPKVKYVRRCYKSELESYIMEME